MGDGRGVTAQNGGCPCVVHAAFLGIIGSIEGGTIGAGIGIGLGGKLIVARVHVGVGGIKSADAVNRQIVHHPAFVVSQTAHQIHTVVAGVNEKCRAVCGGVDTHGGAGGRVEILHKCGIKEGDVAVAGSNAGGDHDGFGTDGVRRGVAGDDGGAGD